MRKILFMISVVAGVSLLGNAEELPLEPKAREAVQAELNASVPVNMKIGKVQIDTAVVDRGKKIIKLDMGENFGYIPLSDQYVADLVAQVRQVLGDDYRGYEVRFMVKGLPVEDFFLTARHDYKMKSDKAPFVYPLNDLNHPKKGLDGKIIAMWQSHGWYFEQRANRWQWQRARIFETVEDLYTQSYVMPFLMPMLENAGAYVMSPRERDTNSVEIIIDNDGGFAEKNGYAEANGEQAWSVGSGKGFAYVRKTYEGVENPFADGTYRAVNTTKGKDISTATWSADIPEDGTFAVYVSYATLPKSADDVVYTVHSAEGDKQFRVNQQMGGGTWIYLGHFYFNKGKQPVVSLSNKSAKKNRLITADAVKVGGGYGNIARQTAVSPEGASAADKAVPENFSSRINSVPTVSGYPRFTEAARYWLQWAGIPDSVYSPTGGVSDYNDDYRCRGEWVNYLAGGSYVLPERKGLNIPVDLSFAFHSDAGTTMDDTIIGTLGIYFTKNDGKYANGTDRMNSRILTDYVMTNIVDDVRAQYDSNWVRRGMWDASYYEARVPEVPAMLLELLSHQNFADMRYGLDPTFRFTVSRAIYKGMVQYFANREGRKDYVIQPLPVNSFAIQKQSATTYRLVWKETADTLCDRAAADKFVVYERINNGGFRQIAVTETPEYVVEIQDHNIHSYKIVAANDGGLSFPSEVLSLGVAENSKGDVLVVNGFTRVSAPDSFDSGEIAGFYSVRDNGVPYMQDINYIGEMFEFRRKLPWMSDDSAGFGASRANYEDKVIAGNTFDYPSVHGASIMKAGYSFVSASVAAVENGTVDMCGFKMADLILGKQKETKIGRGEKPNRYAIYSPALQKEITEYCQNGGSLFVSGAYVATDVWDNENSDDAKRGFAEKVLGYKWRVGQASVEGEAHLVPTYFPQFGELDLDYYTVLNGDVYAVESPDAMYPTDENVGCTLLRYNENGIAAGVVNQYDSYKTCVIGFPFETIKSESDRDVLMRQILEFFSAK